MASLPFPIPCHVCNAFPWKLGKVTVCHCGEPEPWAEYTVPDEPKKLTPVDKLLPGIALTRTARIARDYRQGKLK